MKLIVEQSEDWVLEEDEDEPPEDDDEDFYDYLSVDWTDFYDQGTE